MASASDILLAALFFLLIAIDVTGNTLICLVVYRTKQMRKPMNYLLVNLAVADIVIGVFMLPRHVFHQSFEHPTGTSGNYLCKFITGGGFIWMSAASSGILLIAIAFVRYFAVVHPLLRTFRLDNKQVLWIMAVSWGFAILLTAPSLSAMVCDPAQDFCVEDWAEWYPARVHVAFVFVANFVIPTISMTILYSRIIYKLWCNQDHITNSAQNARLKARRGATVMLINVTFVHTVCWSPNYVLYFLIFHAQAPGFHYGSMAYTITVLLVLLNAAADPLMYTWYMDDFRRGMRGVLCCCHRNRVAVLLGTPTPRKITTPAELGFSVPIKKNYNEGMETSHF